jgi:hypothetical protein
MAGSCDHKNENKCFKKERYFLARQTTTTFERKAVVPLARLSIHFQLPQYLNPPTVVINNWRSNDLKA